MCSFTQDGAPPSKELIDVMCDFIAEPVIEFTCYDVDGNPTKSSVKAQLSRCMTPDGIRKLHGNDAIKGLA